MANLRPEAAISARSLAKALLTGLACASLLGGFASAQNPNSKAAQSRDIPITIDAESSEFDYLSNRLLFRGLRLDQGKLGIRADLAETQNLNFKDGLWSFSGNVEVEVDGASLKCDYATLTFLNHNLIRAELQGAPASFRQTSAAANGISEGQAGVIIYEPNGLLQLKENASFSDGTNKISGALISYDLNAGRISAGSDASGPVKIVIPAPEQNETE